jgi:hypothetical protein
MTRIRTCTEPSSSRAPKEDTVRSSIDPHGGSNDSLPSGDSDHEVARIGKPVRLLTIPPVRRRSDRIQWLVRFAAALIAVGGYVHLCLYRHGYRAIPKIGVSFLLTVVASGVLAIGLLALQGRGDRLARLAGIGLSAGTLAAFAISRTPGGLFNFREIGFQPSPQAALAVLTEGGALLLLVGTFAMERVASRLRTVSS